MVASRCNIEIVRTVLWDSTDYMQMSSASDCMLLLSKSCLQQADASAEVKVKSSKLQVAWQTGNH